MDRQQTGNLLIGAGILAGLGTFAYWYLMGGMDAAAQELPPAAAAGPRSAFDRSTVTTTSEAIRPALRPQRDVLPSTGGRSQWD